MRLSCRSCVVTVVAVFLGLLAASPHRAADPTAREERPAFPRGKIKATVQAGSFPAPVQLYRFALRGRLTPFWQEYQPALRLETHIFHLIDRGTGEEVWSKALPRTTFQNLSYAWPEGKARPFPAYTVGHLLVLPVGHLVFGIDPLARKILWQFNLVSPDRPDTVPGFVHAAADPHGDSMKAVYANGWNPAGRGGGDRCRHGRRVRADPRRADGP